MQADRLQKQRFENKYIVSESLALSARDFVRSYLSEDDFSAGRPNHSYAIHSVYLDSDALKFYRQTLDGEKNRIKLRVRFYDDKPDSPVFLEIKRRTNNVISKQRCPVERPAVPGILSGQSPEADLIMLKDSKHQFSLQNFLKYQSLYGAKPKGHVSYFREAWVSPADNSVRVTMDRDVRFSSQFDGTLSTARRDFVSVFGPRVVLEIKFTNRFPDWFKEFVRLFNLRQCSAAKYAEGISIFGDQRLKDAALAWKAGSQSAQNSLEEVA